MKRVGLLILFVLGLAAAGGLSAGVVAATTTTGTTTTTAPATIASGVTISGVEVGDLTYDDAFAAVRDSFARPVTLVVPSHRLVVEPAKIGQIAYVRASVNRALTVPAGTAPAARDPQPQGHPAPRRRRQALRPRRSASGCCCATCGDLKEQTGRTPPVAGDERFTALATNTRPEVAREFSELKPSVTRGSFGPVIVIRRGSNRLYLYKGMRFQRVFGVATGQSAYPTPLGSWHVVVKWRNPWWYPPNSPWAKGEKPVPPGPGNPLGTRWMGLSASGVGIHGTPDDTSIGYSASHGCIRMHIPDAEWLFNHVTVGTPVFIVSA
jgi:lipoprotein-anchoring transpeptidase ErfK/SrfK